MERVNTNLKRIAIEKERLTQEKGELIVQVTDTERENRHQSEVISSLKADKDSLESALYEVQEQARQLEVRKEQLEGENQELIIRKENLQCNFLIHIFLSTFKNVMKYHNDKISNYFDRYLS